MERGNRNYAHQFCLCDEMLGNVSPVWFQFHKWQVVTVKRASFVGENTMLEASFSFWRYSTQNVWQLWLSTMGQQSTGKCCWFRRVFHHLFFVRTFLCLSWNSYFGCNNFAFVIHSATRNCHISGELTFCLRTFKATVCNWIELNCIYLFISKRYKT